MRNARRTSALIAGVALALALAGCTAPAPASASPSPSASASATAAGDAELPALASVDVEAPEGPVEVIARSVTRDDNGVTVTLRLAFVPKYGDPDERITTSSMNNLFFLLPVLLDRENLKRYNVIEGEGSQDWFMNDDAFTTKGVPLESWYVFAAPEDDIDMITVTIDAWGVEFADIPIEG